MKNFWPASGFTPLRRDARGWLWSSDDCLRGFLARPDVAGKPVYLGLMMNAGGVLRLKP